MRLEKRLKRLEEEWHDYRCRRDIPVNGVLIGEKTMTSLIAATGVGKSTITTRLLELAEVRGISAVEAGTETTRPHRPDDNATYRTNVPIDEMVSRIEAGEYTNWSITPSRHIYATPIESLTAEHNFLPCLPASFEMLRNAGFKALNAFYIVTPADAWDKQIEARKGLKDFPGRIVEAQDSLEFAWRTADLQKIYSEPGEDNLTKTARAILDFAILGEQFKWNAFNDHLTSELFDKYSHDMYNWSFELQKDFS